MKAIKKVFAILLVVAMVMGLSVTAFAATTSGSITVKNAASGQTYTAYKIFDATLADTDNDSENDAYAYTISITSDWLETVLNYMGYTKFDGKWYASTDTEHTTEKTSPFSGNGLKLTLSANGDEYVVTTTDAFSAADFAEALYAALKGYTVVDTATTTTPTEGTTYYTHVGGQYVEQTGLTAFENGVTYYTKGTVLTGVTGTELTNSNGTATASNLELGYYFVTSTLGSLANLTTTEPNVTIYDKNEQPPFDKTVDDADVEIGQTVNYTITGEVPSTTGYTKYDYKVSDTLDTGLTFNKNVTVKFGDDAQTLTTVTDANATLTDGQIRYTDTGFELYFDMTKHQSDVDDVITITYSAVVNENAVVTTEGNPNNATLVYSNDPNDDTSTDTETDEEKVYTVDLTIDKYAGGETVTSYTYENSNGNTVTVYSEDGTTYYTDTALTTATTIPNGITPTKGTEVDKTSTKLSGAEFVLVKKDTENNNAETYYQAVYAYTYTDSSSNATVTVYSKNGTDYYSDIACTTTATVPANTTFSEVKVAKVTWVDSIDGATKVTTDPNGAAKFEGIEAGLVEKDGDTGATYYLRETKAPDGYNPLTADVPVEIKRTETEETDGTVTVAITGNTAEVANSAGTELPSTGGIGTTIFYVVGSILVIGAAVLLITKKRMSGSAE